jgi:hypothetical protein
MIHHEVYCFSSFDRGNLTGAAARAPVTGSEFQILALPAFVWFPATLRGHHKGREGHKGKTHRAFTLVSFVSAAQLPTKIPERPNPEFLIRVLHPRHCDTAKQ